MSRETGYESQRRDDASGFNGGAKRRGASSYRVDAANRISGLPVIDTNGVLVGLVTEGDFLRRTETTTEKRRPRWLEFLVGPGRLADEYVKTHARKVDEIMTREPRTITEDTPLEDVVQIMESHKIKRLPVMQGKQLVGIVSRANSLYALASMAPFAPATAATDKTICDRPNDGA